MKWTYLVAGLGLLCVACSPSYRVIETSDPFEPDSRRLTSSPIELKTPRGEIEEVSLRLGFIESDEDPEGSFFLTLSIFSEVWVLPEELKLLIDGSVTSLRPPLPAQREVEIGGVWEHFTVEIPERLLQQLIGARSAELRLESNERHLDRKLDPDSASLLRNFYVEARRRS